MRHSRLMNGWAWLLTSLTMCGAAFAAEEPTVEFGAEGSYAFWEVVGFEYGLGKISVTGPRKIQFEQTVGPDDPLEFTAVDEEGRPVDGTYRWNLVVRSRLDQGVLEQIAEARVAGDDSLVCELEDEGVLQSFTFSGSFRQVDGRIALPEDAEEEQPDKASLPTKDIVLSDDLIINGSACIGFDCVNGESFGFHTLVLKENNLNIRFQDTSTLAAYPSNDWEILINSSRNGGAERFALFDRSHWSLPFTIEAGARNNSLYVDDAGRVGLGTATPAFDIHAVSSNTPTLRLEQTGSSGFEPQTWDVSGNDANFFVRDATNGSTLPLRISPGAPSSSISIDSGGDVGVGTRTPDASAAMHIVRDSKNAQIRVESTSSSTGNADMLFLKNNGTVTLRTVNDQASTIWDVSNDGAFNISADGTGVSELSLDSSGTLTIQGALLANSGSDVFPDYVFEDGYDLMSLDELKAFLEANGHLPNVPSAAEVKAEGFIDMTALQLKILEKVEELTLYTLDQEETIRSQAAYIAGLTAENRLLQAENRRTSEGLEDLRERLDGALATP